MKCVLQLLLNVSTDQRYIQKTRNVNCVNDCEIILIYQNMYSNDE